MRRKEYDEVACSGCGVEFEKKNYNQHFCSAKCRNDYHNDIKDKAIEHYRTCPLVNGGGDED